MREYPHVDVLAMTAAQLAHEALLYRDADEYLAGTLPFVRDGIAAGEPVLVAVPGPNLRILRSALGDIWGVHFADMALEGRNPGRIIPWVLHAFLAEHTGKRARIIGEPIWPERSDAEYPACVQHEALINVVLADRPATILCPYDTERLSPSALIDARATHPVVVNVDGTHESTSYADPVAIAAEFNRPLPDPPASAPLIAFGADDLRQVRGFLVDHARAAGLPLIRLIDLEIAVNEVTTNAIAHTGGPAVLRIWTEPGRLVCEIRDPGPFTNYLAGRLPPPAASGRGRGLLLVNQVCDLVRLHAGRDGTTIRLYFDC